MPDLNAWWWASAAQLDSIRCPNEEVITPQGDSRTRDEWHTPPEWSAGRIWPWTINLIGDHESHFGYCRACEQLFWVGYHTTHYEQGDRYYAPHPQAAELTPATLRVKEILELRSDPQPNIAAITDLANRYPEAVPSCNDDDWICYSLLWNLVDCLLLYQEQPLQGLINYYYWNRTSKKHRGLNPDLPPIPLDRPITALISKEKATHYLDECESFLSALKNEMQNPKFNDIMWPWSSAIKRHRRLL